MLQSLASSSCVRLMQNHKSTWYFASLLLGYILYLIFGAIIFSSVELPYEDLLRQELRAVKQRFLQENECLSEERLERFLKTALDASSYGVSILKNASVNWNWDFTSSLFFASTVLSTTGESGEDVAVCQVHNNRSAATCSLLPPCAFFMNNSLMYWDPWVCSGRNLEKLSFTIRHNSFNSMCTSRKGRGRLVNVTSVCLRAVQTVVFVFSAGFLKVLHNMVLFLLSRAAQMIPFFGKWHNLALRAWRGFNEPGLPAGNLSCTRSQLNIGLTVELRSVSDLTQLSVFSLKP